MSELKVYHCNEWHNEYTEFYLKYDVDKVMAEKDERIDLYKRGFEENDKINAHLYAELRHNQYKRCLNKADFCLLETAIFLHNNVRKNFYYKWHKRWLELAEKFKEAK